MAKFQDRQSCGRSKVVPYKRGEGWQERHGRRLSAANAKAWRREVERWCSEHEAVLTVSNDGHHWIINPASWPCKPAGLPLIHFAQWWPSSAKLVFGSMFTNGIHCHDVTQLLEQMNAKLEQKDLAQKAENYARSTHKKPAKRSRSRGK